VSIRRHVRLVVVSVIAATVSALDDACYLGAPSCATTLPDCPTNPPSYASVVAPIIAIRCVSCHSPGGVEPVHLLETYDEVFKNRGPVLDQVDACLMPQDGSMPESERTVLLTWFVCDAPNN
jgi:hypothetical protein